MNEKRKYLNTSPMIVKAILSFINDLDFSTYKIDPGMATSKTLLIELDKRGYKLPKKLNRNVLGHYLHDSKQFDSIRLYDRQIKKYRVYYKMKKG